MLLLSIHQSQAGGKSERILFSKQKEQPVGDGNVRRLHIQGQLLWLGARCGQWEVIGAKLEREIMW